VCGGRGFESDKEGLYSELGALRESLNRSAQAIESITSEAESAHSARPREYSQKMRRMASNVPACRNSRRQFHLPASIRASRRGCCTQFLGERQPPIPKLTVEGRMRPLPLLGRSTTTAF
jgi:hypothetical protein